MKKGKTIAWQSQHIFEDKNSLIKFLYDGKFNKVLSITHSVIKVSNKKTTLGVNTIVNVNNLYLIKKCFCVSLKNQNLLNFLE